ncbi:MAG: hypothetical protein ACC612_09855 [Methanomethylovorans sp.]|jgi:hypothetical protein
MRKNVYNNENEHHKRTCGFHDVTKGRIDRSCTPEELEIYCFMMGGILGK